MSWAIDRLSAADAALDALDFGLQEQVHDLLDALAEGADDDPPPLLQPHLLLARRYGRAHGVEATIESDPARRVVVLTRVVDLGTA